MQPVCGIDSDQDSANLCRSKLRDYPFRIVRRPDSDMIAFANPGSDHTFCHGITLGAKLCVGVADAVFDMNQAVAIAEMRSLTVEEIADGDRGLHSAAILYFCCS